MQNHHFYPGNHINNLVDSPYYKNLIKLRNLIALACDDYFQDRKALKVDLYMLTKGASSPMGRGSDSKPISLELGKQRLFLVDSAQFGMEPLVQKNFEMVYCYLPSFRGEDSDYRHINQFYHCEAELRGGYTKAIEVATGLVKHLLNKICRGFTEKVFEFENSNFEALREILNKDFPSVTFDETCDLLEKNGYSSLVERYDYGRVITSEGESRVIELVTGNKLPFWITRYDRDVVAFYQKPDPSNPDKVLNADLILPSINGSFGGEVLGLGQRQDNKDSLIESMNRQGIKEIYSYKWYLDLRDRDDYTMTSGFGLGIERLLAWTLGIRSIADVAIYPVLKSQETNY
ncbi:hypothetical protein EPN83_01330 [Patescibacteria group bacterium]|nr:MAG: hypothetical protein EPN83_01330 [Patescibacteria group bacterium]